MFIIYGEEGGGGGWKMGGGGKRRFTHLYRGARKALLWGRGGQEKFDSLYPSVLWVLNFCKNCMTFGNWNEFYKFKVLAISHALTMK